MIKRFHLVSDSILTINPDAKSSEHFTEIRYFNDEVEGRSLSAITSKAVITFSFKKVSGDLIQLVERSRWPDHPSSEFQPTSVVIALPNETRIDGKKCQLVLVGCLNSKIQSSELHPYSSSVLTRGQRRRQMLRST